MMGEYKNTGTRNQETHSHGTVISLERTSLDDFERVPLGESQGL